MTTRIRLIGYASAALAALTLISSASAQVVRRDSGDWANSMEQPYGTTPGQENQPITGSTRDANGNRVIVNGMYQGMSSAANDPITYGVGNGMTGASSNATAVGNLLNVQVTGNYNTVIVHSDQQNTGSQTAVANGTTQESKP